MNNRGFDMLHGCVVRVQTKEVAWPERERRLQMANDALKEEIDFLKQCLNLQGIPPAADSQKEASRGKLKRRMEAADEAVDEPEMKTPDEVSVTTTRCFTTFSHEYFVQWPSSLFLPACHGCRRVANQEKANLLGGCKSRKPFCSVEYRAQLHYARPAAVCDRRGKHGSNQ